MFFQEFLFRDSNWGSEQLQMSPPRVIRLQREPLTSESRGLVPSPCPWPCTSQQGHMESLLHPLCPLQLWEVLPCGYSETSLFVAS